MEKSSICFFSNNLDKLADLLFENLFQEGDAPFSKKVVVVPNGSTKNFLMERLAISRYQIATGVKIATLPQAIELVLEKSKHSDKKIPSPLELSFLIETKLREIFSNWDTYPKKDDFAPLAEYFNFDGKIGHEQRLPGFCDKLSRSFIDHGIWESLPKEKWQTILWEDVYVNNWIAPRLFLQEESTEFSFYFFHVNFLPQLYLDFFIREESIFYELSPCEHFWEDVRSDKERLFDLKKFENRGVKTSFQEEWNDYVVKEHRLLSNLGKVGREFSKALQEKTISYGLYSSFPDGPIGLLPSIQRGLLSLEEKETKQKVASCDSIQVHIAPSLFREVEICKQVICQTLENNKGLEPNDIIVMSTDIEKYFPYLEMIFHADSPSIPIQVEDVALPEKNHLREGIQALLSLVEKGFSKESIAILFSHPRFIKKLNLEKKEALTISKWIDKIHLRKEEGYSWDVALNEILFGLMVSPQEEIVEYDHHLIVPIAAEEENRDLLCVFIQTIQALQMDLASLVEKQELSLKSWVFFFINILQKYFYLREDDQSLIQELQSFCFSMKEDQERFFPYTSARRIIDSLFNRKEKIFFSAERNTIRFCKFDVGKFTSSKVIYLLGMDEESFPRKEAKDTFFSYDIYKPSRADLDRYLFLETLICAEKYLIMSYVKFSSEDQKEQKSSFVLQELFHYIDHTFWQDDSALFSKSCVFSHPSFTFDRSYFSNDRLPFSYSETSYEQYIAHQNSSLEKTPFLSSLIKEEDVATSISIKDLEQFAKDPVKFYFKKKMGLYLDPIRTTDEFEFSGLDRYIVKKLMYQKTSEEMIKYAGASGKIPSGFPGKLVQKQIQEEHEIFSQHLDQWQISKESIFSVILQKGLRFPKWETKNLLHLPSLKVTCEGKEYHIVGKIEGLTSQGMLCFGKGSTEDLAKIWPAYLIYLAHPDLLEKQKRVLFSGEKKVTCFVNVSPEELLKKYIQYFQKAKNKISPCMPAWIELIDQENLEKLSKEIESESDKEQDFPNEYLVFLRERKDLFTPEKICKEWKTSVQEIFSPLMKGNYEKV